MAKHQSQDLPGVEGPGVSLPKFKDLDKLGDRFIEKRDEKAKLAQDLTKIEGQIVELMEDKGLTKYQFADQELLVKRGKVRIKIKSVQVEGVEDAD